MDSRLAVVATPPVAGLLESMLAVLLNREKAIWPCILVVLGVLWCSPVGVIWLRGTLGDRDPLKKVYKRLQWKAARTPNPKAHITKKKAVTLRRGVNPTNPNPPLPVQRPIV